MLECFVWDAQDFFVYIWIRIVWPLKIKKLPIKTIFTIWKKIGITGGSNLKHLYGKSQINLAPFTQEIHMLQFFSLHNVNSFFYLSCPREGWVWFPLPCFLNVVTHSGDYALESRKKKSHWRMLGERIT